ncbi:MAG: GNAT family N-acetyltransferase [Verrucomicrobia bacterium]|nr:GNAT family N-acetyltransferase [Verrucomicrobiota bacterium]
MPADAEAIAGVYRDAVRRIGPVAYSEDQVEAWARHPLDINEFRIRLSRGVTLVMEEASKIIAFGQLEPYHHIAFLYTDGAHNRQGVGSQIYDALEQCAQLQHVSEIQTEASRISRPFFQKKGYEVVKAETVIHFGVEFERFQMAKHICLGQLSTYGGHEHAGRIAS